MSTTPRTALLLIDIQQGLDDPKWGERNNPNAEQQIAAMLAAWRRAKWPVIHVQHMSQRPTSPLRPNLPGNAFKPEAVPLEGEPVFQKTVNSAFIGTPLEDHLRREGIRSLVVKLGITRSLGLAQLLHLLTFVALLAFGFVANLGALYYWSLPLIAAALVYEHKTEKRDLAGINRAFFQSNAFVSAVFLIAVCADRLIR